MKVKLAVTAALVTVALTAGGLRAFAQTAPQAAPTQNQAVDAPEKGDLPDAPGNAEVPEKGDTADVVGQADVPEKGDVADTAEVPEAGEGSGPDTDNVQDGPQ